tara:strand:- start:702 stop:968 length:267 start_codon:yes stop_codon:yes gene_type:complete
MGEKEEKIFNEKASDLYQVGDLVEFIGGMNQYSNYDVGCGIVINKYVGHDDSLTAFRIWFDISYNNKIYKRVGVNRIIRLIASSKCEK